MTPEAIALLSLAVSVVAFLYSSVGHAGASGYIAVMTLFSLSAREIKPIALGLNILVATITFWQFWRAGHFSWKLFWPFGLFAIPCAFLGGYLNLPTHIFNVIVGIVLLASAARFLVRPPAEGAPHEPAKVAGFAVGAGLGLLAGLTGTGGGIFLTPLVIFLRWARTKTASAVSALFILANSISGLLGNLSATKDFPSFAWPLAASVMIGGTAGSYLGSRKLQPMAIKRLLAVVLTIAGLKLILSK